MRNFYREKFVAACVATLIFLVMQSSIVMAMDLSDEGIYPFEKTTHEYTKNPSKPTNQVALKENVDESKLISDKEKDLLARLVEAEAKGEPYEGKVAVATVVLNRVDSPEFPDTITNVVYEVTGDAYAFSPVQNGEIKKPASLEAKEAVEDALTSQDRLDHAVYFYNPEIASDKWIRSRKVVERIDNHVFAI